MFDISRLQGLIGIVLFFSIAWALSTERKQVKLKPILLGLGMQFVLALIIFKVPFIKNIFVSLTSFVHILESSMHQGAQFVFGYLGGGESPFVASGKGSSLVLALQALPLLIFMSALSALLFYWGILPVLIRAFSYLFEKTLGIGGALGLGSAANIFFGMDAAPMSIRPHLKEFSQSELFSFMTVGMATVAGTVMVVYATILDGVVNDVIGHVLSASIISIPAAITISKIMIPQIGSSTAGKMQRPMQFKSSMDAISQGTLDGVNVYINVIAMLLSLVALVSLANSIIGYIPYGGSEPLTFQMILGMFMRPLVWMMGIPWEQAQHAGMLMATKTVLNELIAYIDLSQLPLDTFDPRSKLMIIYAMCGFANISSVGIMIGAMGTLVPERRTDIVDLGLKTLISGTLATMTTGAIVGIFY